MEFPPSPPVGTHNSGTKYSTKLRKTVVVAVVASVFLFNSQLEDWCICPDFNGKIKVFFVPPRLWSGASLSKTVAAAATAKVCSFLPCHKQHVCTLLFQDHHHGSLHDGPAQIPTGWAELHVGDRELWVSLSLPPFVPLSLSLSPAYFTHLLTSSDIQL